MSEKNEIMTLEGLRELLRLKEAGIDISGYNEKLVQNYINYKIKSVEKWREHYENMEDQLIEACNIATKLGFKWQVRQ